MTAKDIVAAGNVAQMAGKLVSNQPFLKSPEVEFFRTRAESASSKSSELQRQQTLEISSFKKRESDLLAESARLSSKGGATPEEYSSFRESAKSLKSDVDFFNFKSSTSFQALNEPIRQYNALVGPSVALQERIKSASPSAVKFAENVTFGASVDMGLRNLTQSKAQSPIEAGIQGVKTEGFKAVVGGILETAAPRKYAEDFGASLPTQMRGDVIAGFVHPVAKGMVYENTTIPGEFKPIVGEIVGQAAVFGAFAGLTIGAGKIVSSLSTSSFRATGEFSFKENFPTISEGGKTTSIESFTGKGFVEKKFLGFTLEKTSVKVTGIQSTVGNLTGFGEAGLPEFNVVRATGGKAASSKGTVLGSFSKVEESLILPEEPKVSFASAQAVLEKRLGAGFELETPFPSSSKAEMANVGKIGREFFSSDLMPGLSRGRQLSYSTETVFEGFKLKSGDVLVQPSSIITKGDVIRAGVQKPVGEFMGIKAEYGESITKGSFLMQSGGSKTSPWAGTESGSTSRNVTFFKFEKIDLGEFTHSTFKSQRPTLIFRGPDAGKPLVFGKKPAVSEEFGSIPETDFENFSKGGSVTSTVEKTVISTKPSVLQELTAVQPKTVEKASFQTIERKGTTIFGGVGTSELIKNSSSSAAFSKTSTSTATLLKNISGKTLTIQQFKPAQISQLKPSMSNISILKPVSIVGTKTFEAETAKTSTATVTTVKPSNFTPSTFVPLSFKPLLPNTDFPKLPFMAGGGSLGNLRVGKVFFGSRKLSRQGNLKLRVKSSDIRVAFGEKDIVVTGSLAKKYAREFSRAAGGAAVSFPTMQEFESFKKSRSSVFKAISLNDMKFFSKNRKGRKK
jgi:hypothetical protein